MKLRQACIRVVEIAILVVIAGLLLGVLLGQPIMFGFVETGSMSPTIETNDGFIAVPEPLSGDVSEGDVIVFEAERLHGGELTTHRVVEETDDGYITQGDANPFTDQDGEEPPVQDDQIVATALQVGDTVIVIPGLGHLVGIIQSAAFFVAFRLGLDVFDGPQSILLALFVTCMLAYAYLLVKEKRSRTSPAQQMREVSRSTGVNAHHLVIGATVVVVVLATFAMVYPTGTHEVSITTAGPGQAGIQPGETETDTVGIPNSGYLPQVVVFDAEGAVIAEPSQQHIGPREVGDVELEATAPDEPGATETHTLSEHRYWAVLPVSTITTLHDVHPWVALASIITVIAIPFYVGGRLLVGAGRIRLNHPTPSDRSLTTTTRLRRLVRKLY